MEQLNKELELQTEYKRRILNYFPTFLKTDVEKVINIMPLTQELTYNFLGKEYKIENGIQADNTDIHLPTETIRLTGRLFFTEPEPHLEIQLTTIQKNILNCIYTSHVDGYIREKRLKLLINVDDYWVLPFKLQLLGEFVIEILFELDKHITEQNIKQFKQLTLRNKKFWTQTKSRMISWWDADYRYPNHKRINDYIGQKIVKRINKANA